MIESLDLPAECVASQITLHAWKCSLIYRFIEAMDYIKNLQVIWVPRYVCSGFFYACKHKSYYDILHSYIIYNFSSDTNSKGTFKSIRKAVELAKEAAEEGDSDKLSWYLAMTDSLVGNIMIMSADTCTESEQKNLKEVQLNWRH